MGQSMPTNSNNLSAETAASQVLQSPWINNLVSSSAANSNFASLFTDAKNAVTKDGLPTTKNEDWKYTNLSRVYRDGYKAVSDFGANGFLNKSLEKGEKNFLHMVDGVVSLSTSQIADASLVIANINDVFANKDQDARYKNLADSLCKIQNVAGFVSLNQLSVQNLICIYVPKNTAISSTIEICREYSDKFKDIADQHRLLIYLEDFSSATIFENTVSHADSNYFRNTVSEVVCGVGSNLTHINLQNDSKVSTIYNHLSVDQKRDSVYTNFNLNFGGGVVRNEISPKLDGSNVTTNLYGLTSISGDQHVDNHTVLNHAQPNSQSNEIYRGVYNDSSTGVFNGTIIVQQIAQKTNAIQSNNAILLSKDARINSKPQLKIFADDVKCTHGATVGMLSKESLFYLRSRGISETDAKQMLVRSFLAEVLEEIENEEIYQVVDISLTRSLSK